MTWTLLVALVVGLGLSLFTAVARRQELVRMAAAVRERDRAVRSGSEKARLQHPVVDLSRCLGCGTCVAACPEDGVLELVHGQAMVVNGVRCVGVSACERECPVGAIAVTLGDLRKRDDVPVLTESLEALGSPGLFLAGEVTAHALVKTAIDHGVEVADEVARRLRVTDGRVATEQPVHDLIIVGAGPAGLACALEARRQGLDFVVLEQESTLGGTVAKYPRAKLVLTQPLELPLAGRFKSLTWTKEDLIALWERVAGEHALPFEFGEALEQVTKDASGFVVRSTGGERRARFVCLALGRRGTPRRLDVPGEDLRKVAYSLIDAHSHRNERILVVGGGDSAIETALGLAAQPGNDVTLSYRKDAFFRIRARNEEQLQAAVAAGRIRLVLSSEVVHIDEAGVELTIAEGPSLKRERIDNDRVFVMVGGTPPFELLERSGVSFDATLHRAAPDELVEQGTGLVRALAIGLALASATLVFALGNLDYYGLARIDRPTHLKHGTLRPGDGTGLLLGLGSLALIGLNLLYLVRRSPRTRFTFGSLRVWMTSHIATGILAFLFALLHSAMAPRNTVGGHAFWLLAALLVTGAVGRYLYAWVPRAANGRELALAEVKARLGRLSEHWTKEQRDFRERARKAVDVLIERSQWRSSFTGRFLALAGVRRDLDRVLRELRDEGRRDGLSDASIAETVSLARRAHRIALMAAHYEDLRALLNAWRWLHRWGAVLLVALVVLHVAYALLYGEFVLDGGGGRLS